MLKEIDGKAPGAERSLSGLLTEVLGEAEKLCIICAGTDRWTGDCLGPITGERLRAIGPKIKVIGTLEKPLKGEMVVSTLEKMKADGYTTVVIDGALGTRDEVLKILVADEPIALGRAIGREQTAAPSVSIQGIVNRGGMMAQTVLQNTRLYHVHLLSKIIARGIADYCGVSGANTLI